MDGVPIELLPPGTARRKPSAQLTVAQVVLVDSFATNQALSMTDRGVRVAQQQSNEYGFIPDAHSEVAQSLPAALGKRPDTQRG